MSIIQLLVLDPERLPDATAIAEAAATEAESYQPEHADLIAHEGFLPVAIGDEETGFEYYFVPIEEGQLPHEATQFGNHQIIARTSGDAAEMLASLLFLRTAARLSGAAYIYPDEGVIIEPDEVDEFLTVQIEQIRKLVK